MSKQNKTKPSRENQPVNVALNNIYLKRNLLFLFHLIDTNTNVNGGTENQLTQ